MPLETQAHDHKAQIENTSDTSVRSGKTMSPEQEYKNDILTSLKQYHAGQVIDHDKAMQEIRRELGIDAK